MDGCCKTHHLDDDTCPDHDWKSTSINMPEIPYGHWIEKLNEKLPDVDIL